jgi:hypothetical protein
LENFSLRGVEVRENVKLATFSVVIMMIFSLQHTSVYATWTNTGGGDHGGQDWIITTNTTIAGNHYNIRLFKIASGVMVTVQPYDGTNYGFVEIHAENIEILGSLIADNAGYRSGEGTGAGGSVSGSATGGTGGSAYGDTDTQRVEMGSGGGSSTRYSGGIWVGGGGGGGYGGTGGAGANALSGSGAERGATAGGGRGGGRILLFANSLIVSGILSADGQPGADGPYLTGGGGGGSGGGILVCAGEVTILGSIRARGGKGGRAYHLLSEGGPCGSGGGGGGGRVKIFANLLDCRGSIDVSGGAGGGEGDSECVGAPGSQGIKYITGAPFLLHPENDATFSTSKITFQWSDAQAANYRLLISSDPCFTDVKENRLLPGTQLSENITLGEGQYYWKVLAIRSGENSSKVFTFRILFPPEILSVTCDNALVDRKVDTGRGVGATRIEVTVRDNGGRAALTPENVRLWIRDASGLLRVENAPATSFSDVDENIRRFSFVFDPPDDLPDSSLGPFDVKVVVFDNYGLSDNEDFAGMGYHLFTVNDLRVSFSLFDNTPTYRIQLSGNAFRVYDNASTTLDNAVVVDNNEGEIQATFTENSFFVTYGLVLPVRLHRGDLGQIYIVARDDTLDGGSQILTYQVEGDNLKILNPIPTRYVDRTEVVFEAKWALDGTNVGYGTVCLPENSQISCQVLNGSGKLVIPHSARVKSGNKTLTCPDDADRPLWLAESSSFFFNVPPTAVSLNADGKTLPARVSATPIFSWVFEDNNPNDTQISFRIQVGSNPDDNDLWDYTGAGSVTSVVYGGKQLSRGQTYYVKILVQDSRGEWQNDLDSNNITRGSFTVNNLPTTSNLLINGQINPTLQSSSPLFSWAYSDPDGDDQTHYQIQVGTSLGSWDVWDSGQVFSKATCAGYGGPSLSAGRTYYVRVRTKDGCEWSDWATGTFTIAPVQASTSEASTSEEKHESKENLDNVAPRIVLIQAGPEGEVLYLVFECVDESEISSLQVWIDNRNVKVQWDGRRAEVKEENLEEGLHTVLIRAADVYGNENLLLLNYKIGRLSSLPTTQLPPLVSSINMSGRLLSVQLVNRENRPLAIQAYLYVDGRLFRILPIELRPLEQTTIEVEIENLEPGEHEVVIYDAQGYLLGSRSISIPATVPPIASTKSTNSYLWLAFLPGLGLGTGLVWKAFRTRRKIQPVQIKVEEIPEVIRSLAPLLREERNDKSSRSRR